MTLSAVAPAPKPAPPALARYMQATRAYSFPASIVPVLVGSALDFRGYGLAQSANAPHFSFAAFGLTLVGALLAQAGGNVINDYFDFVHGVDTRPEHGSGVLPSGLLTAKQMLCFGWGLLLAAALCGLGVVLMNPAVLATVVPLALVGLGCAVLYTWFLKKWAMGDLVIMTAFGFGLMLGAYGVQASLTGGVGQWGLIALLSIPVALLVDAILHANNIRDAEGDKQAGVTTVAYLLGAKGSQAFQALLLFGPVALVVAFSLLHLLPYSCLATLLVSPVLVKAYKTGDVPFVAQSHLMFGVLYALTVAVMARPA